MSNIENDRAADVTEAPSTSVVLKDNINLDVSVEEKKENWMDNKGKFSCPRLQIVKFLFLNIFPRTTLLENFLKA